MEYCRILIADDEPRIRKGLSERIDWASIGCEVCAVADDGDSALSESAITHPDIIISDINMPKLNGLEFCRKQRELNPGTEIIILTGFDEFEFAREAIEIGVSHFVVKPVDNNELLQLVEKLAVKIRRRRKTETEAARNFEESLVLKKKEFLLDLINGHAGWEEFDRKKISIDQFCRKKAVYSVVLVSLDNPSVNLTLRGKQETCLTQRIQRDFEKVLIHNFIICIKSRCIFPIVMDRSFLHERLISSLEWMQRLLESEFGIRTSMGIGGNKMNPLDLHSSLLEADEALAAGYLTGSGGIWEFSRITEYKKHVSDKTVNLEIELYSSIQSGSVVDTQRVLGEIKAKIHTIDQGRATASQILMTVLRYINAYEMEPELAGSGHSVLQKIASEQSVRSLFHMLEEYLIQVSRAVGLPGHSKNYARIEAIKQYILENITEPLSLVSISRKMRLSPTYLSNLFKKETGENISIYIIKSRIGHAKALLEDRNRKIYQVAYESGFKDPNYFNAQFKKFTGISPGEYQKLLG